MTQSHTDLETYNRLRVLDQERKRLVGRYEMSRPDSPVRDDFAHQIYACDQAIERLLGVTLEEQEQNLARIMESVKREQNQLVTAEFQMVERDEGINQVTKGFGCLLIAGIVTAITYFAAEPGDSYYVLWGGMAWGAWMILSGIMRTKSSK